MNKLIGGIARAPASQPRTPAPAQRAGMARYKDGGKVKKVMGEFKRGELRSGSRAGPVVRDKQQALAIALAEQRKEQVGGYADGGAVRHSPRAEEKFRRACRGK